MQQATNGPFPTDIIIVVRESSQHHRSQKLRTEVRVDEVGMLGYTEGVSDDGDLLGCYEDVLE